MSIAMTTVSQSTVGDNSSTPSKHSTRNYKSNQMFKSHILQRLLQSKDEKEKLNLRKVVRVIKYLSKNQDTL